MSRSNSDDELDEPSQPWVPYSKRPNWADVKPIKQDDGPNPVVRIAYSERFSTIFDYIRACMHANEMSQRALDLTKDACEVNPANYTVWCYRRQILEHLRSNLKEELTFIGQIIKRNPKNYQVMCD